MDLKSLIQQLLALRPGADMALHYYGDGKGDGAWTCEFVNPCSMVSLGESSGEFHGDGKDPEDAVLACIERVRASRVAA
jgi:hypothetical protein